VKSVPVVVLLFALLRASFLCAQDSGAVIQELSGRVEVQAPGSSWVPASVGMVLEKAARISTGFDSSALIALGASTIRVRQLTRLTLEEIAALEGALYLEAGRIRAEVTAPGGGTMDFSVRSPIVTASVRGTSFEFDTINLSVGEGWVRYVSTTGSRAAVRPGERSMVNERTYVVSAPREEAVRSLAPALPPGSEAGGRLNGDGPATVQGNLNFDISAGW
jgi:hypothetical protein